MSLSLSKTNPFMAQLFSTHSKEDLGCDILVVLGMMAGRLFQEVAYDPSKTLILFTSDRREEAEAVYRSKQENYALIHSTSMGDLLENFDAFKSLPGDIAYLGWYLCAAQLLLVNKPQKVMIIATPENELSTLWNFELPLLQRVSPSCVIRIQERPEPLRYDEMQSLCKPHFLALCKPHFLEYMETGGTQGELAKKWTQSTHDIFANSVEHQKIRDMLIEGVRGFIQKPAFMWRADR